MKESPLRDAHISIDGWNVDKPPRISGEIVDGQRKKERKRERERQFCAKMRSFTEEGG